MSILPLDNASMNIEQNVLKSRRKRTCNPRFRGLRLGQALRIKSGEYWLKVGQPDQAMRELRELPPAARKHPSSVKALVSATRAIRDSNKYAIFC